MGARPLLRVFFWEWPPFPALFFPRLGIPWVFLVVNSDQALVFWECWIFRDEVGAAPWQSRRVVNFPGILGGNFWLFWEFFLILSRGFFWEGIIFFLFLGIFPAGAQPNPWEWQAWKKKTKTREYLEKNDPKFPNFLTSIHHLE